MSRSFDQFDDAEALARIIEAEAASEPLIGKLAVGAVIDNRRKSGAYGKGWKGVITKPGQFSAINDVTGYAGGKGANSLFWRKPSEESLRVARAVIAGGYEDPTGGATHYYNPRAADPKWARGKQFTPIGNHVFGRPAAGRDVRVAQNSTQMSDAQPAGGSLRKITDPDLLRQLGGQQAAPQQSAPQGGALRKITDPTILRQLQGGQPEAGQTPDGPQPGQVLPQGGDPLSGMRTVFPGGAAMAEMFLPEQGQRDLNDVASLSLPEGATGTWSAEMQGWLKAAPKEAQRLVQQLFANAASRDPGADPAGVSGPVPPSTYDQDYLRGRMAVNVAQADIDRRQPGASTVGKVTGGVGTAVAAPSATALAAGTGGKVMLGAGEGAAIAGTVAAGSADPGQRMGAAVGAAPGGALLGGAGARAGIALERYLALRAARKAAPTSEGLKEASQQLYEAAANSGVVYKPQPVADLVTDVSAEMTDQLIDPNLHPKASAILKRLPELVNKPATLREVERYRRLASEAARSAEPGSADQRLASMIVEQLDEFTMDQGNMVATSGGAELQREARRLWAQYRKDQLVQFQVEKAVRRAESTGSGGNANNAIRQNIRSILDNRKLRQGFTPEEIAAMETVVRGGSFDNILRLAGKLSPSGNGLMLALQTGGAAATNGASLPLAAVGAGAKSLADSATTRRVKALAAMIRAGAKPPFGMVSALSRPERRALAKLTAATAGPALGEDISDGVRTSGALGTVR